MARLHEYQGKVLLRDLGIPIPNGGAASTAEEAAEIALGIGKPVVVKAQIWVTGRAGLGAIRFADTPQEAAKVASEMLGKPIKGFTVDTVLVEEKLDIEQEFYVGVIINDQMKAPVMIFSSMGGTGIEEIALEHPEAVHQIVIDIRTGLADYYC